MEKEKAAEAVVPDPEALQSELCRSQEDKMNIEADFSSLKSRLPVLEQQIQDRTLLLKEHKETHQRLAQVKARESKAKFVQNIDRCSTKQTHFPFNFCLESSGRKRTLNSDEWKRRSKCWRISSRAAPI